MPFHPRRMAPLGEPHAFLRPRRFTWSAVGVIVGSLKMALSLAPAAMTSRRTRSSVSSRFFARRSKNSHALVSTWGSIQRFRMRSIVYRVISSPATYTIGAAGILPDAPAAYPRDPRARCAALRGAAQARRREPVAERRRCIALGGGPFDPSGTIGGGGERGGSRRDVVRRRGERRRTGKSEGASACECRARIRVSDRSAEGRETRPLDQGVSRCRSRFGGSSSNSTRETTDNFGGFSEAPFFILVRSVRASRPRVGLLPRCHARGDARACPSRSTTPERGPAPPGPRHRAREPVRPAQVREASPRGCGRRRAPAAPRALAAPRRLPAPLPAPAPPPPRPWFLYHSSAPGATSSAPRASACAAPTARTDAACASTPTSPRSPSSRRRRCSPRASSTPDARRGAPGRHGRERRGVGARRARPPAGARAVTRGRPRAGIRRRVRLRPRRATERGGGRRRGGRRRVARRGRGVLGLGR